MTTDGTDITSASNSGRNAKRGSFVVVKPVNHGFRVLTSTPTRGAMERARRALEEVKMTEKAENPVKKASQEPDNQNKTTEERVEKQSVEVTEKQSGDFVKGTVQPDKEG